MISVHPLILLYIVLKLALKTCKHHFRWAASFFSLFFSVSFRRWVLSLVCSFFPLFLLCVCFLFLFCWIPSAVWMTKSDLLVSSFLFDGTCRIPFTILWISICCSGTIICVGGFVSNKTGKRVCVCVCVYVCVCVPVRACVCPCWNKLKFAVIWHNCFKINSFCIIPEINILKIMTSDRAKCGYCPNKHTNKQANKETREKQTNT